MRPVLLSACFFGCCLAASPAFATDTVAVPYTQADLTSTATADALFARVSTAANLVCKAERITPLDAALAFERSCRGETLANAIAAANLPALTASYEAAEHPDRVIVDSQILASR
jgi:UrcA family protein